MKAFSLYLLSGDFVETNIYCLEKFRRSTLQKIPKRHRDNCRTYRNGNEKKKVKVVKETEINLISGAIKKFVVKENITEIEKSDSESLSCLKDYDLHNLCAQTNEGLPKTNEGFLDTR